MADLPWAKTARCQCSPSSSRGRSFRDVLHCCLFHSEYNLNNTINISTECKPIWLLNRTNIKQTKKVHILIFICWSYILLKDTKNNNGKKSVCGLTRVKRVTYKVCTNPSAQLALNPQCPFNLRISALTSVNPPGRALPLAGGDVSVIFFLLNHDLILSSFIVPKCTFCFPGCPISSIACLAARWRSWGGLDGSDGSGRTWQQTRD